MNFNFFYYFYPSPPRPQGRNKGAGDVSEPQMSTTAAWTSPFGQLTASGHTFLTV